MSAARFALVIHPDASFKVIDWEENSNSLNVLYREIDFSSVAVVDISPKVAMWLDDDGIIRGAAVNRPATAIYATIAPVHQNYYGTAVFTGIDSRGNTTGLTYDRCEALLELAGIDIAKIPQQRNK
ncbi:DUF3846 domain-containing protein [Streptomyces sp. E-15]